MVQPPWEGVRSPQPQRIPRKKDWLVFGIGAGFFSDGQEIVDPEVVGVMYMGRVIGWQRAARHKRGPLVDQASLPKR